MTFDFITGMALGAYYINHDNYHAISVDLLIVRLVFVWTTDSE